ncbi:MAG TPA: PIG-L family deacetylase, partial [Thermoanaerobaculia bacterium]|nr:PIG-L family deacetylase [Thermoanaerobaculia bacterium]
MRNLRRLTAILLFLAAPAALARSAAEIKLELKKLTVVGSALYVAAHPDDENTAMLAYLANDRLVRTGYLSCTRGDGGQNLLGNEKGELLGLIRTQELLSARRIDGAEQWFTRALDFGYTKSPQETLSIWDRDKVLADVVWVIRLTQPDVIITRFPTTGEGGHGQHTASAILAEEAFRIAGDPTKFPEQLQYVAPWQPKRIFWNRFNFRAIDPNTPGLENDLKVDVGAYNALLGRSYTEIAGDSRSMHKSQGFGAAERRGTAVNYLKLTGGEPAKSDAFDGVNLTWSRYAGGEREGALLQQAYDTFDFASPAKSVPILLQAVEELDRLGATPAWSSKTNPWIAVKRRELLDAIRDCAGLSIDVSAADSTVTPGGLLPVSVTVVNRSEFPLRLQTVAGAYASPGKAPDVALQNNQPVKVDIALKVPDDEAYSQPYWLRHSPTKGMYIVDDQRLIGRPENPPPLSVSVGIGTSPMQTIVFNLPVVYRWVDAVRGEQVRTVDVVPPVTANLDEAVYLFPDAKAKTIGVKVRGKGDVALDVPQGWRAASLTVTPPAGASTGTLRAMIGGHVAQEVYEINYPHIPAQRVFSDAAA